MQYAGKILPKIKRSACYREGRLPESERTAELPGHASLLHSTTVTVAHNSRNQSIGNAMRRLNKMFTTVDKADVPVAARKGRAGKDLSSDPMYQALKNADVNTDGYMTDGKEYAQKDAAKLQSKIAAYAKAGAGTFRTSYRAGKVYIQKIDKEYKQQRSVAAEA